MAPKASRAVSSSNVGAKRAKVSRELSALREREDALEFQADLEFVKTELAKDPDRMKSVKAVFRMPAADDKPKDEFGPSLEGRQLARIPLKFVADKFFGQLEGGMTAAELKALQGADTKVALKLLCKVCVVTPSEPLGPLSHEAWLRAYTERYLAMGSTLPDIKWNRKFEVDWQASGHFSLWPKCESDDTENHIFQFIDFKKNRVPLGDDLKIKGTFIIAENWCHSGAKLMEPSKPWIAVPCWSFFSAVRAIKDIEPLFLSCPEKKTLAIADGIAEPATTASAIGSEGGVLPVPSPCEGTTDIPPSSPSSSSKRETSATPKSGPICDLSPILGIKCKPPTQPPKTNEAVSNLMLKLKQEYEAKAAVALALADAPIV
jgi:hypothetical protein